ncbi:VOC family protein [Kyrpidia tusciae]|uniref:Glyoxalase/bleomycin resistance protein/dioxygenase n=1 Tax=Kyrpidia tusciae (strain DSM 2912 / NBRC 15312 / T2) TaxID=562970 RepID=D5WVJ8_KYRT2|nr:VOC family protein [Kyrpidia tusciae]ADG07541.1 Glyoxalase/bleomycin resistance protein/dioxygenase [Kyrpidia tusciae DSM 2912]
MANITCLSYVVFGVSDLPKWEDFGVEILGLQVGRREEDQTLAFRMDEYEQRIILEKNSEDDLIAAGWEFNGDAELEEFVRETTALGIQVVEGGKELAQRRRVEKIYTCDDPNGFKHEFVYGPAIAPTRNPFRSKKLIGPGFVTGRLGAGHILVIARDYEQSVDFYHRMLRLRFSDYIREEVQPGVIVDATFFHTVTGRHHSLATAQMPIPKRIHHFMLQVQDMNDVGLAYERCLKSGYRITMGLGHHPNDRMFSFYVQTPSGFEIEYGWGGIVIDDANWEVKSYSQLSSWGHKPVAGTSIVTSE